MTIDTSALIPIADAEQDLSRVVRLVDEQGLVVLLKNDRPRYAVIDLSEYDVFQQYRKDLVEKTTDRLIEENLEAFLELAK